MNDEPAVTTLHFVQAGRSVRQHVVRGYTDGVRDRTTVCGRADWRFGTPSGSHCPRCQSGLWRPNPTVLHAPVVRDTEPDDSAAQDARYRAWLAAGAQGPAPADHRSQPVDLAAARAFVAWMERAR